MKLTYSNGLNTAKDPSELDLGEMVRATGIYYKPGNSNPRKIRGVTTYGTPAANKPVDGIALLQFDSPGTDKLVALSDRVLYGSDLSRQGVSGSFSSLKSGLGTLATSLSAAQFNDEWFLGLGSENVVVQSDGTTRSHGMRAPLAAPTAVAGTGTIAIRAANSTSNFTNPGNAYDTGTDPDAYDTFAYGSLSGSGTISEEYGWTTANTGANRIASVSWAVAGRGIGIPDYPGDGAFDDVGGTEDAGFSVRVKLEVSEDGGASYTTFLNQINITQAGSRKTAQVPITDTTLDINGNLKIRATLAYSSGDADASLRIYDVQVNDGGTVTVFTTTTGIYYSIVEYDENTDRQSPPSEGTLVTFTNDNFATITRGAIRNDDTTHWLVYRTKDGGSIPQDLGQIGSVPIADSTFIDTFAEDTYTETPTPLVPLLRTLLQQDSASTTPLYFAFNSPPRRFARIRAYEGSLVGLSADNTRALFYSAAGFPDAWPEINVIDSFPFEEHDELVDCMGLGTLLIIAAKGTMMRLTSLPRVVNSVRDTSRVEQIRGAPGCVGRYGMTFYAVSGAPRVAWISPYGVYVTNGDEYSRISDDIDWNVFDGLDKSRWALQWDPDRLCLIMQTEDTGDDRSYFIHLSPEHRKDNGNPKWTGPHYGDYRCYASGQVASTRRLYAGHSTNGSVYALDRGGLDSSFAYGGGADDTLALDILSGKIYGDGTNFTALDAFLYHTDFGGNDEATVTYAVGNDSEVGGDFTLSTAVSLSGHKSNQFDVSQSGQWAQVGVKHTGPGQGAIRDVEVRVRGIGLKGSTRVA